MPDDSHRPLAGRDPESHGTGAPGSGGEAHDDAPTSSGDGDTGPGLDASRPSSPDSPDVSEESGRERDRPAEPEDEYRPWQRRAERLERDGLMHLERGQYERAGEHLVEALRLYERHGAEDRTLSVAQYLGVSLHELGKVDQAVAIWEEMMDRGWSGPTIFGLLLRHYEQEGRPEEIKRLYERLRRSITDRAAEEYAPLSIPEVEEPPTAEDKPRILLADNDEEVRGILARLLRMEGYLVEAVGDGEAALREVLRSPPDIVILDVYMPKRSGLDVLYQLRARGMTTRAVVISGVADDAMVRDAVVLGAEFLGKPIQMSELRDTLAAILDAPAPEPTQPGPD